MAFYLIFSSSRSYGSKKFITCNAESGEVRYPATLSFHPLSVQPGDRREGPFGKIIVIGEQPGNGPPLPRAQDSIREQADRLRLAPHERRTVMKAYERTFRKQIDITRAFQDAARKKPAPTPPPTPTPTQAVKVPDSYYYGSHRALRRPTGGPTDYSGLPMKPGARQWWKEPMKTPPGKRSRGPRR